MAEFSAGFKVYADASQFHREMKEATEGAKRVQRGLKDIGINIGQFLGVTAMVQGFRTAIQSAQELRDKLEEVGRAVPPAVRSVAEYGDAWDRIRQTVADLAVSGLGFFTRAGEGFGMLINRIRGISAEEEKARERSAKDAERLERQRDEKYRNNEQIQARQKADREAAAKKAEDDLERESSLRAKSIQEQRDAVEKLAEFEREQRREKMTAEQRVIDLRKEQKDVTEQIGKLEKFIKEGGELTADGAKDLLELKQTQAELQKRIAEDTEKMAQAEQKAVEAAKEREKTLAAIAGIRTSRQFGDASDAALREVRRRNEDAILSMGQLRNIGQELEVARLQAEIQNVTRELAFRSDLRRDVSVLGVEGARSRFQGDPLQFDRVVQQLVQDNRDTRQILADTNRQLQQLTDGKRSLPVVVLNQRPGGG